MHRHTLGKQLVLDERLEQIVKHQASGRVVGVANLPRVEVRRHGLDGLACGREGEAWLPCGEGQHVVEGPERRRAVTCVGFGEVHSVLENISWTGAGSTTTGRSDVVCLMTILRPTSLAALTALSLTLALPAVTDAQHVAEHPQRARRPAIVLTLSGAATNVTANASAGVRFTMTTSDDANYAVEGAFDATNLFGRFVGQGRRLPCDTGICVQVDGTLSLGGDGSGFPEGTRARFVLSVAITGTNANGVYHIGRLEGVATEQYGFMMLSLRR